jgi:hypothetical protein
MRRALPMLSLLLVFACDDTAPGGGALEPGADTGVMGQPPPPDGAMSVDPGRLDAAVLPDLAPDPQVAQRIMTWVCDGGFDDDATPEDLELAEVAGGDAVLRIAPAEAPCTFHLEVAAPDEAPIRVSDTPSGYLLAAGVERSGVRAVCASRIEHRAADEEGQADPAGRMVRRETTGVSIVCGVGVGERWTPLFEVVPSSGDSAPWVTALSDNGDGGYTLTYDRDFSFQFLNLTPLGRPDADGTYTVDFSVDAEGALTLGAPQKMSDAMAGAPAEAEDPDACPAGLIDPSDPRCAPRCGDGTCDPDEGCDRCEADCGLCALVMDDAHEPGYLELDGEWQDAPGRDEFSRWTDAGRARYTFDGLHPGWKSLAVSHPGGADSTGGALYRVLEGAQEVARFVEDQRVPVDGEWKVLGRFPSRGDLTVEISALESGRLRADAVRVARAEAPPPVVDDGDGLYREVDGEWRPGLGGHDGDHRASVGGTATFTLPTRPGIYAIAVHLPDAPLASARAELTLSSDGAFVAAITLDQRAARGWLELGRYRLPGQQLQLTWTGQDDLPLLADAVRAEPAEDLDRRPEHSVDDGDATQLLDGLWAPSAAGGEGGDAHWTRDPDARARWQFTGLAPDFHDVLVAWPSDPDNTAAATYSFSTAGGGLGQVIVDQTAANSGWVRIGTVWTGAPVLTVTVTREGGGTLYADAIKLVSTACADCAD